MPEQGRFGSIEAGGTKFVIAAGTGPDDLTEPIVVPTTQPGATIASAVDALRSLGTLQAVGIASFGPLDLDPESPNYGSITKTPKPDWSGTPVRDLVADALGVFVAIDTDVAGAAVAESRWGAGRGDALVTYMTVGTGIGVGLAYRRRPLHGRRHPEGGHIVVPRHPDDQFGGVCPYHGDCLEGMASGPAIEARWGRASTDLGPDAPQAVALVAWYLGTAVADLLLAAAPDRLIVGGGVAKLPGLLDATRERADAVLRGYASYGPEVLHERVVAPGLGDRSGVLGGIALAALTADPG